MVALPEEAGLLLAVEGIVPVKVLLAEVDPEVVAFVDPVPETETAVAVHWAFFVVEPAPGFEIVAAVSVVVAAVSASVTAAGVLTSTLCMLASIDNPLTWSSMGAMGREPNLHTSFGAMWK